MQLFNDKLALKAATNISISFTICHTSENGSDQLRSDQEYPNFNFEMFSHEKEFLQDV